MKVLDTSAIVAAFASWHENHDHAVKHIGSSELIGHCALETISVLTRLPEPHRIDIAVATSYLTQQFPKPWLSLNSAQIHDFIKDLPELKISGGSIYDALIATTALHSKATLISCDKRAYSTYQRIGVETVLI